MFTSGIVTSTRGGNDANCFFTARMICHTHTHRHEGERERERAREGDVTLVLKGRILVSYTPSRIRQKRSMQ